MRVAIMQPYFCPYIGYFQLMNSVDQFVIFDNIQFVDRGWIHRNRILVNGKPSYVTLHLHKDSRFLDVRDRRLRDEYQRDNAELLRRIELAYRGAPRFKEFFPVVERILGHSEANLFAFVYHSIQQIAAYLDIRTPVIISSTLAIDHGRRAQDKLLAICANLGASTYINLPGGRSLYDPKSFSEKEIVLQFLEPEPISYRQFGEGFVDHLSIVDLLMFNTLDQAREQLSAYVLKA